MEVIQSEHQRNYAQAVPEIKTEWSTQISHIVVFWYLRKLPSCALKVASSWVPKSNRSTNTVLIEFVKCQTWTLPTIALLIRKLYFPVLSSRQQKLWDLTVILPWDSHQILLCDFTASKNCESSCSQSFTYFPLLCHTNTRCGKLAAENFNPSSWGISQFQGAFPFKWS